MKPLTAFEKQRVMYWIRNWLRNPYWYRDNYMTKMIIQVRDDASSVRVVRTARSIIRLSNETTK